MTTDEKLLELQKALRSCGSLAVAFSGGVDSGFLLKTAHEMIHILMDLPGILIHRISGR